MCWCRRRRRRRRRRKEGRGKSKARIKKFPVLVVIKMGNAYGLRYLGFERVMFRSQ